MNIDVNELEVIEDIASLAVVTGEKREKYLFTVKNGVKIRHFWRLCG